MPKYTLYTDEQLFDRVCQGDDLAFKELYERYWDTLWHYVSSTTNADDAKDIIQDVFTSIWQKRTDLQLKRSFRAYLYRTTLNKIIDRSTHAKYAERYKATLAKNHQ
ncbi:hypothetical protein GCM10023231_31950 [Olivibacter ginsenosidimutans]|uniref:RNA polymerase sigma-70 region 2 domain-containing protein n=1 Tax=Olivibacter ginsenosidimutans TaxID=1176537 RepID=A0ABP9BVQ5_9SPHI